MFRVSADQLDALSDQTFPERVRELLRSEFPDAAAEDTGELLEVVREQIEKGRSYGISDERGLAVYTSTAWLLGADFDTRFPAAQAVLNSRHLTPVEQQEWLVEFTQALFKALKQG